MPASQHSAGSNDSGMGSQGCWLGKKHIQARIHAEQGNHEEGRRFALLPSVGLAVPGRRFILGWMPSQRVPPALPGSGAPVQAVGEEFPRMLFLGGAVEVLDCDSSALRSQPRWWHGSHGAWHGLKDGRGEASGGLSSTRRVNWSHGSRK